jgi:hypothetical protein
MATKKITLNELKSLVKQIISEENNIKEYFGGNGNFVNLTEKGLNLTAVLEGLSSLRSNRPELYHKYFPNIYNK